MASAIETRVEPVDFIQNLGHLALGSRLKRLSDRIMAAGQEIYARSHVGFEPRWFPLFRLLADRGPMSMSEAATALRLTNAAISQVVRPMTKAKLVVAKKDPRDERKKVLSLTTEGEALLPSLRPLWDDIERAARELTDFAGIDLLAAIDGVEQALDEEGLFERTARIGKARALEEVEIVDYEPQYAKAFRDLNVEWLEKHFEVEPVDEAIFERPEKILEDGGTIVFARLGDEIVGTCALVKQKDGYEVAKMGVTEKHRGKHIGKKLLEAVIDRARAMGLDAVFLITNSGLIPAVTLYRTAGFRVTHSGPHPKYARGDLVMSLDL